MKVTSISLKSIAATLSVVLFLDTLLVPLAQAGFWEERRSQVEAKHGSSPAPITLASLPAGFQPNPTRDLTGLLPIASNSLRTALPSRPTKNPYVSGDKTISDILSALPSAYGTVRNIQTPAGASDVVIHIQDVHMHAEAQRYISKAIQGLLQQRKVDMVGLEGAFSPVSLSSLQGYDNQHAVRKAADYALEKNEIAGPVHAALLQPTPVPLIGVDDREGYKENVNAYTRVAPYLAVMQQRVDDRRATLATQMTRECNPLLLEFLSRKSQYAQGTLPIGGYLGFLEKNVPLPEELKTFLNALKIEQSLDFQQVELQRARLVTRLGSKLSAAEMRSLLEYGAACRLGRLGHAQLYAFLMGLCRRHGVVLGDYPAMEAYLQYVLMSDGIDGERLMSSLSNTERQLSSLLSHSVAEQVLVREHRELELINKLVQFSLTPNEWAEYKKMSPTAATLSANESPVSLKTFENFYVQAENRNRAMVENLLREMKHRRSNVSVVVTGGFHAFGMSKLFAERRVSTLSFVPRITTIGDGSTTENLGIFTQQKAPLETLFQGERLFLSPLITGKLNRLPFHVVAVEAFLSPLRSARDVFGRLSSKKSISVTATRNEDGTVSEVITTPRGSVEAEYTMGSEGRISEVSYKFNGVPEAVSLLVMLWTGIGAVGPPAAFISVWVAMSIALRAAWYSAIFTHGFGHVFAKWMVDKDHPFMASEITEGVTLREFVKGVLPFQSISVANAKPVAAGEQTFFKNAVKASGGVIANLIFLSVLALFIPEAGRPAFLLLAGMFVFVAGIKDVFDLFNGYSTGYACGIMFIVAKRLKDYGKGDGKGDGDEIVPNRIQEMAQVLAFEMAAFGSHGIGMALRVVNAVTGALEFIHFKIPSGYGQNSFFYQREGRTAFIKRFLGYFFDLTNEAEKNNMESGEQISASGHVRLKTSPGGLTIETTQGFNIDTGRTVKHWKVVDGRVQIIEEAFKAYGAANGDFQKAERPGDPKTSPIPGREGDKNADHYFSEAEWGAFFTRAFGLEVGDNDSEKAIYFMYFLRTKGLLESSLLLGYVGSFFKTLSDPVPSVEVRARWAARIESVVKGHLEGQLSFDQAVSEAATALRADESFSNATTEQMTHFVSYALNAFLKNDAYQAAKEYMKLVNATSTYGLFFESTLEPGKRVLISREQPVSIAENVTKNVLIGGSSLDFVKQTLRSDKAYTPGDELRSLTFVMSKDEHGNGGEITEITTELDKKAEVKIFSMAGHGHELTEAEVAARWKDATNEIQPLQISPLSRDPVENDLLITPAISRAIHNRWREARASGENPDFIRATNKFADRLIASAKEYADSNALLINSGRKPMMNRDIDVAFMVFREENIALANYFSEMMASIYPGLNIKVINGSEYIADINKFHIGENTNVVMLDIGYNFSEIRAAEEFERRAVRFGSNRAKYEEERAKVKELETAKAIWHMMEKIKDRLPPEVFIMTPNRATNISRALSPERQNVIDTMYYPNVDGSSALLWSQIVTFMEMQQHVLERVRDAFPQDSAAPPFLMTLSENDIQELDTVYQHMIFKDLTDTIGQKSDAEGTTAHKVDSARHESIVAFADELTPYFTEQARALTWVVLHVIVTVGLLHATVFDIPVHVLSLLEGVNDDLLGIVISYTSSALNTLLYIYFPYITVLLMRIMENRRVFRRNAMPSLVFGDDTWCELLTVIMRKWFGLAKGIVTPAIYGYQQSYRLEGALGASANRSSLVILNGESSYDERNGPPVKQKFNAASTDEENEDKLAEEISPLTGRTKLVKNQVQSFASMKGEGPMVVGFTDIADPESMGFTHTASAYDPGRAEMEKRLTFTDERSARKVIDLINKPTMLMAQLVAVEHITRKIATADVGVLRPILKYFIPWDRQDNQNSMAATTQIVAPPPTYWEPGVVAVEEIRESLSSPAAKKQPKEKVGRAEDTTPARVSVRRDPPQEIPRDQIYSAFVHRFLWGIEFYNEVKRNNSVTPTSNGTEVAVPESVNSGTTLQTPSLAVLAALALTATRYQNTFDFSTLFNAGSVLGIAGVLGLLYAAGRSFLTRSASPRSSRRPTANRFRPSLLDAQMEKLTLPSAPGAALPLPEMSVQPEPMTSPASGLQPKAPTLKIAAEAIDRLYATRSGTAIVDYDAQGHVRDLEMIYDAELGNDVNAATHYERDGNGVLIGMRFTETVDDTVAVNLSATYVSFDAQGRPTEAVGANVYISISYNSDTTVTERLYFAKEGVVPTPEEIERLDIQADRTTHLSANMSPLEHIVNNGTDSFVVRIDQTFNRGASSSDSNEIENSSGDDYSVPTTKPISMRSVAIKKMAVPGGPMRAPDQTGIVRGNNNLGGYGYSSPIREKAKPETGIDPRDLELKPLLESDESPNPTVPAERTDDDVQLAELETEQLYPELAALPTAVELPTPGFVQATTLFPAAPPIAVASAVEVNTSAVFKLMDAVAVLVLIGSFGIVKLRKREQQQNVRPEDSLLLRFVPRLFLLRPGYFIGTLAVLSVVALSAWVGFVLNDPISAVAFLAIVFAPSYWVIKVMRKKPYVTFVVNQELLTLHLHAESGVRLENSALADEFRVDFRVTEEGFQAIENGMVAMPNSKAGEIVFEMRHPNTVFQVLGPAQIYEYTHMRMKLPRRTLIQMEKVLANFKANHVLADVEVAVSDSTDAFVDEEPRFAEVVTAEENMIDLPEPVSADDNSWIDDSQWPAQSITEVDAPFEVPVVVDQPRAPPAITTVPALRSPISVPLVVREVALLMALAIVLGTLYLYGLPFVRASLLSVLPASASASFSLTALQSSAIGTGVWLTLFIGNVMTVFTMVVIAAHLLARIPVLGYPLTWSAARAREFRNGTEESKGWIKFARHILQTPIETIYSFGFRPADQAVRDMLARGNSSLVAAATQLAWTPVRITFTYLSARVKMLLVSTLGRALLLSALGLAFGAYGTGVLEQFNLLNLLWGADHVRGILAGGGVSGAAVQLLNPFAFTSGVFIAVLWVSVARAGKRIMGRSSDTTFLREVAVLAFGFHFVSLEIQIALWVVGSAVVLMPWLAPLATLANKIEGPHSSVLSAGQELMGKMLSPFGLNLNQLSLGTGPTVAEVRSAPEVVKQLDRDASAMRSTLSEQKNGITVTAERVTELSNTLSQLKTELTGVKAAIDRATQSAESALRDPALDTLRSQQAQLNSALNTLKQAQSARVYELKAQDAEMERLIAAGKAELAKAKAEIARVQNALSGPRYSPALQRELDVARTPAERENILRNAFASANPLGASWLGWYDYMRPYFDAEARSLPDSWTAYKQAMVEGAGVAHAFKGNPTEAVNRHPYLTLTPEMARDAKSISTIPDETLKSMNVFRLSNGGYAVPADANYYYPLQGHELVVDVPGRGLHLVRPGVNYARAAMDGTLQTSTPTTETNADLKAREIALADRVAALDRSVANGRARHAELLNAISNGERELAAKETELKSLTSQLSGALQRAQANADAFEDQARRLEPEPVRIEQRILDLTADIERTNAQQKMLEQESTRLSRKLKQIEIERSKQTSSALSSIARPTWISIGKTSAMVTGAAVVLAALFKFISKPRGPGFQRAAGILLIATLSVLSSGCGTVPSSVPSAVADFSPWILAHGRDVLYWAMVGGITFFAARQPSTRKWQAVSVFSMIGLARVALEFAPTTFWTDTLMYVGAAGLVGYLVPPLIGWALRRKSKKEGFKPLRNVVLIAASYLVIRAAMMNGGSAPASLDASIAAVAPLSWPAASAVETPKAPVLKNQFPGEISLEFANVTPLWNAANADEIAVPVKAHVPGYVQMDPASGISAGEWQRQGSAFAVKGGQPLLRLVRPVVETEAEKSGKLVEYLKKMEEHFKGLTTRGYQSRETQLYMEMSHLLPEIAVYAAKQNAAVYGLIKVPGETDEQGWILPGHRLLGNANENTVLARYLSANRLTVQVAVPTAVWQHYDVSQMQVKVLVNGRQESARVVTLDVDPRLNGEVILTLGLVSENAIFEWNSQANQPRSVSCQLRFDHRKKPVNYTNAFGRVPLVRAYSVLNNRVAVPVTRTDRVLGRLDVKPESTWVGLNETVATVTADDLAEMNRIVKRSEKFVDDANAFLKGMRRLIDRNMSPINPAVVQDFTEATNVMRTFAASLKEVNSKAPRAGLLVETPNAEGEPVRDDRTVAKILTPQITATVRIGKTVLLNSGIKIGDIVIVRRPGTGDETLGIVRQIKDQLTDGVEGEDQSQMQAVQIEISNDPRNLWFADGEYGIQVVFVPQSSNPDANPQNVLRARYEALEKQIARQFERPDSLPATPNLRFVPAADAESLGLLIQQLEESVPLPVPNATASREVVAAPAAKAPIVFKNNQVERILGQENGEDRRTWLNVLLQDQNVAPDVIDELVLNSHGENLDVGQLGLDYLLRHRRVEDLIRLHRSLYAVSPEGEMTQLARAHVVELIETGATAPDADDPLKRLEDLDQNHPMRAPAQEMLISILSMKNAAFDPSTAVTTRRILSSRFWRTYAERYALSMALDEQRRHDAALLVRSAVFADMARHTGWSQGFSQHATKAGGPLAWWARRTWDRLHAMDKNWSEDQRWLDHSPWALSSETDPLEYFNGRINNLLYVEARHDYEELVASMSGSSAPAITVLTFASPIGNVKRDYVFERLNARSRRTTFVPDMKNLHAMERMLRMADRTENAAYRDRRRQVVNRLIEVNTAPARLLLARALIGSNDPDFMRQLLERNFDNLLAQDAIRLAQSAAPISEEHPTPRFNGMFVLYQQALAKLAATPAVAAGRPFALRAAVETLSDFELIDFLHGRHGLRAVLLQAGLDDKKLDALAKEQLMRRSMLWAIPLVSKWYEVTTVNNQVITPQKSALKNIENALALGNFDSDRLQTALQAAHRDHPSAVRRLLDVATFREQQIVDGPVRDVVTNLETKRVRLTSWLMFISVTLLSLWSFFTHFGTRGTASKPTKKSGIRTMLSSVLARAILPGAILLGLSSSANAAHVPLLNDNSAVPFSLFSMPFFALMLLVGYQTVATVSKRRRNQKANQEKVEASEALLASRTLRTLELLALHKRTSQQQSEAIDTINDVLAGSAVSLELNRTDLHALADVELRMQFVREAGVLMSKSSVFRKEMLRSRLSLDASRALLTAAVVNDAASFGLYSRLTANTATDTEATIVPLRADQWQALSLRDKRALLNTLRNHHRDVRGVQHGRAILAIDDNGIRAEVESLINTVDSNVLNVVFTAGLFTNDNGHHMLQLSELEWNLKAQKIGLDSFTKVNLVVPHDTALSYEFGNRTLSDDSLLRQASVIWINEILEAVRLESQDIETIERTARLLSTHA